VSTTRHLLVTPAHTSSYLEAGPEEGPLLVFVHGWPGLGSTWRYPLEHFPERCLAAATLAIAFGTLERGWDGLLAVVDRDRYPEDTSPYGQFDYMAFYENHAKHAVSVFEAAPGNTVKELFRRGDPAVRSRPASRSAITRDGGWFGGANSAPDAPLSSTVLTEQDFDDLTAALTRNG
jgi:soluble epoxide hydrolase / lipid-phosphate phosphatase